jgi:RNA polymerase sigma factor for flagellar operon FliA
MSDPLNPERLFLEHLGWIERAAAMACAKAGVKGAEADDFAGWIKVKLIEDDYAAIRRFRGDAKLTTYLASVITRQLYEYQRERGGRWRPSAAAVRLGPPAPDLEALVYRDRYTLAQAGEKLRTGGRTGLSDIDLARLLARLPSRGPLRPVQVAPDHALPQAEASQRADDRVVASEADRFREKVTDALARVMDRLEPEDRMLARMHFGEGRSLAEVARTLRLDQKPLYRRVDRLRRRLREDLLAEGVGDDVLEVLSEKEAA